MPVKYFAPKVTVVLYFDLLFQGIILFITYIYTSGNGTETERNASELKIVYACGHRIHVLFMMYMYNVY
jgi:hypothetical protein